MTLANSPASIQPPPSRRSLLGRVAMWVGLGASYGTFAAFALRYIYPGHRPPVFRSIYAGRLAELADGGTKVVMDLNGVPVQVVRQGDTLHALSTVCPHLGCRVRWEAQNLQFRCPCHNAAFDREGKVLFGPPPRDLDRYDVEVIFGSIYVKMKERTT